MSFPTEKGAEGTHESPYDRDSYDRREDEDRDVESGPWGEVW